jgi:pimeloyl-ACP methyl ester carboxylesterase
LGNWQEVQTKLGSVARVCSYNRLGAPGSDPLPAERQTFESMAADLDAVMTALDVERSVIVVGHSLGGPIVMTWAAAHRDDVKGVVLVDATSPHYVERDMQVRSGSPEALSAPAGRALLDRQRSGREGNPENLDQSGSWLALMALPSLGAVPLVVLTADPRREDPRIMEPGLAEQQASALEAAWMTGQEEWARSSDNSQHLVVDGAGHFIQIDRYTPAGVCRPPSECQGRSKPAAAR